MYEHQRQDIHFMLIGSGPMLEQMQELSIELEIDRFVEFTGRIPDSELLERLSSCDICVNPDKKMPYNDSSTMNKIMEYMAMGKPIVQFDLMEGRNSAQGASLYAKGNDAEDFADKILQLLADPELRRQMGTIGLQRMEKELEWRYQIPKLLKAYDFDDLLVSAPKNTEIQSPVIYK